MRRLLLAGASGAGAGVEAPASQTVSNVIDIAGRRAVASVQVVRSHGAGVVATRSLEDVAVLVDELHETIAGRGALGTVTDHLDDGVLRVAGIEADTVVRLHDTRVGDTVAGGTDVDTAVGFLHDGGKDETRVDVRVTGDGQDALLDVVDLLGGVVSTIAEVGAGLAEQLLVGSPQVLERGPLVLAGEAGCRACVALVSVNGRRAAGAGIRILGCRAVAECVLVGDLSAAATAACRAVGGRG